MKELSLHRLKNGGDSGSLLLTATDYKAIQGELAEAVKQHIVDNAVDQQIEEVIIKWRAPLEREYSYLILEKSR